MRSDQQFEPGKPVMRRSNLGAADGGSQPDRLRVPGYGRVEPPRRLQTGHHATSGFPTRRLGGPRAKPSVEDLQDAFVWVALRERDGDPDLRRTGEEGTDEVVQPTHVGLEEVLL
jgi:hypothetical protein